MRMIVSEGIFEEVLGARWYGVLLCWAWKEGGVDGEARPCLPGSRGGGGELRAGLLGRALDRARLARHFGSRSGPCGSLARRPPHDSFQRLMFFFFNFHLLPFKSCTFALFS